MIIDKIIELVQHKHRWRRMTSEQDYGRWGSEHYGGYHGHKEEICKLCGVTRYVRGWQEWKYELDDAEARVKYLKDTEPERGL